MGRNRKAWLFHGTGVRYGLPGYYVMFNEYTGKRRTQRSVHFADAKAAKRWRDVYNARQELLRTGALIGENQVPIMFREAVAEFIRAHAARSRSTRSDYATALGRLAWIVGGIEVSQITGANIDDFVRQRLADVAQPTVQKYVRALKHFFNWAVSRGYSARNPVAQATATPSGQFERQRPTLADADLARIVAACKTEDQRIAVWLAITTGLDRGVIARLTRDHIDLHSLTIRYKRFKSQKYGSVPLDPRLAPLLEKRCTRTAPPEPLLNRIWHSSGSTTDWWHSIRDAAGLPNVIFRDLRAVFVCRAQDQGGLSLTQVQRLANHSSPEVTARNYRLPDSSSRRVLAGLPLPGHSAAGPESPALPAAEPIVRRPRTKAGQRKSKPRRTDG